MDNMGLEPTQQYENPAPKKKPGVILIVSLVLAVVSILGAAGVWYTLTGKIDTLTTELSAVTESSSAIQKENASLKADQTKLQESINIMKNLVFINSIAHDIEGAAVTDDFVVEKVYLQVGDDYNLSSIVIDVDNQPEMSYIYKGKGAYELSDRELRAKSEAIIDEVYSRYGSGENIPVWNENTYVGVTVKNYEIGNKQSGEFKLVGETK